MKWMTRKCILGLLLLAGLAPMLAPGADAAKPPAHNPYWDHMSLPVECTQNGNICAEWPLEDLVNAIKCCIQPQYLGTSNFGACLVVLEVGPRTGLASP